MPHLFTSRFALSNAVDGDSLVRVRLNGSERWVESEHAEHETSLARTSSLLEPSRQ